MLQLPYNHIDKTKIIYICFDWFIIHGLGTGGPIHNNGDLKRTKGISKAIGECAHTQSQLPLSR